MFILWHCARLWLKIKYHYPRQRLSRRRYWSEFFPLSEDDRVVRSIPSLCWKGSWFPRLTARRDRKSYPPKFRTIPCSRPYGSFGSDRLFHSPVSDDDIEEFLKSLDVTLLFDDNDQATFALSALSSTKGTYYLIVF